MLPMGLLKEMGESICLWDSCCSEYIAFNYNTAHVIALLKIPQFIFTTVLINLVLSAYRTHKIVMLIV